MFKSCKWIFVAAAVLTLASCKHIADQMPNTTTQIFLTHPPCTTCGSTTLILGQKGDKGEPGAPGKPGDDGDDGNKGDRGPPGKPGENGKNGKNGENGKNGSNGKNGERGLRGEAGAKGEPGPPGNSFSLSDPKILSRFLILPFLAWVLNSLVQYSLKRIHLLRTLYIDIDYRIRLAVSGYKQLENWEKLRDIEKILPPRIIWDEKNRVFDGLQSDARSCLWGNELAAVHLFYRKADLLQQSFYKAGQISDDIRALFVAQHVEKDETKNEATKTFLKSLYSSIDQTLEDTKLFIEGWLSIQDDEKVDLNELELKDFADRNYEGVATKFFWRPWIWHWCFAYAPFCFALSIGLFFIFSISIEYSWQNSWVILAVLTSFQILLWWRSKKWVDKKILKTVLQTFGKVIDEQAKSKRTLKLLGFFEKLLESIRQKIS